MFLKVMNFDIAYQVTGDGPETVVILQGWGTSYHAYDSITEILKSRYRVVQFDFPGFGDSTEPSEGWSVNDYTAFFIELMQTLNIERAVLLGHSFGGRVILKLTGYASLPFSIEKIVMVDSAGIMPKRSFRQKLRTRCYKLLKKLFGFKLVYKLFPDFIDAWRRRQGSEDYRNASPVMRQTLVKAVNEDLTELLPGVQPECLLIWGANDTATPVSDGKKMEQMMPNAGLAVIQNAGHFSFIDQPGVFRRILEIYLGVDNQL